MTPVVINPSSSQTVTGGIGAARVPRSRLGVPIRGPSLAEGPPAIDDRRQVGAPIAPVLALAPAPAPALACAPTDAQRCPRNRPC